MSTLKVDGPAHNIALPLPLKERDTRLLNLSHCLSE